MVPESISTDGRRKKMKNLSPLVFVNGQIISEFQNVYRRQQGKTLLNFFTVLLAIRTPFVSFTSRSWKLSSESVGDMWNHMLQFCLAFAEASKKFAQHSQTQMKIFSCGFLSVSLLPSSAPPPPPLRLKMTHLFPYIVACLLANTNSIVSTKKWVVCVHLACVHACMPPGLH